MADVPAFHSAGRSAWHGDGPGTRRLDLELDEDEPSSDFEDLFSDENLRRVAMVDDLEQVNHLEIRVDTREQVLSQLGERLPSLRELKLSESVLSSVRDLGTRLRNLQVLWVARCGLPDLDGIAALDGLRELYAAFNDIADLSPLAMHDRLEVVDVDSNAVADPDQVAQLATCPRLHTLTLEANPICAHPHYRRLVCHNVRSLEWLDDQPVSSMDRLPPPSDESGETGGEARARSRDASSRGAAAAAAEDAEVAPSDSEESVNEYNELLLVAEGIKYARADEEDEEEEDEDPAVRRPYSGGQEGDSPRGEGRGDAEQARASRPLSARSRPLSARLRPGSSARPGSRRSLARPLTGRSSGTGSRPSSQGSSSADAGTYSAAAEGANLDTSSSLTHGSAVVFAGPNPVMAMRRRRQERVGTTEEDEGQRVRQGGSSPREKDRERSSSSLSLRHRVGSLGMGAEARGRGLVLGPTVTRARAEILGELRAFKLEEAVARLREAQNRGEATSAWGVRPGSSMPAPGRGRGADASASLDAALGIREERVDPLEYADSCSRGSSPHGAVDAAVAAGPLSPTQGQRAGRASPPHGTGTSRHQYVRKPPLPRRASGSAGNGNGGGDGGCGREEEEESSPPRWAALKRPATAALLGRQRVRSLEDVEADSTALAIEMLRQRARQGVPAVRASGGSSGRGQAAQRSREAGAEAPAGSAPAQQDEARDHAEGQGEVGGEEENPPHGAGSRASLGPAVHMSDEELVAMLRRKPKHVPELGTRQGFRRFFFGIESSRMRHLLETALGSGSEGARARIEKRMGLMEGYCA